MHFVPRCIAPRGLVVPSRIDPTGLDGPTPRQAGGPRWRRTTPGRAVPSSTTPTVEQWILEESQRLPPDGAVGGWAALRLHGAAYFDGEDGAPVVLVVPRPGSLAPRRRTCVVRPTSGWRRELRHGIACVDAVTALLDVVHREPDVRRRVVAVDMALAAKVVTLEDLQAVSDRQGVRRLREALPLVDGRSASPPESWLRLVWVLDAGLPAPRSNWPLFDLDDYPLGRPDLVCEEIGVVAEYDGPAHADARRRRRDSERRDDYRAAGLEVVTIVGGGWGHEVSVSRQLLDARDRSARWRRPRGWRLGVL